MLLSIVLVLACANKEPDAITAKISTKYYMVKSPSEKDEKLLLVYSKSSDRKLASQAKSLLAGYYVKTGNFNKSNEIFKEIKGSAFDSTDLGLYLSYWRIISNIENGKAIDRIDISKITSEHNKNIVLKDKICSSYAASNKEINTELCLISDNNKKDNNIVAVKEAFVVEKVIENSSQFYNIEKDNKIVMKNLEMNDTIIKGLLFSIKENNLNFQIEHETESNENTVAINGKNKIIEYKESKIKLSYDFSQDAEKIFNYVWNKNPDMVIVGINDRSIREAVDLKGKLEDMGIKTIILNYEVSDFRTKLEIINEEYGDKDLYFIGFGSEKSMTEFVPIVKFMNSKPEEVEICVVTDIFSSLFFSDQFRRYFKNVEVMTYLKVNGDYWSKKFQNGYKFFYDEEPDADAYIGFDMALKLATYINKDIKEDFVSNIDIFINDKAVRTLKIYKIIDHNNIKHVNY